MTIVAAGRERFVAEGEPDVGAVTRLAVRLLRRGTILVLLVAAGLSALVAVQYHVTFADAFDPASLQALAANPAIRALFGRPVSLEDPGGFTVWRTGTFTAVLVGVWSLLSATRVTRGEEEAGRWDLLLAGRLRLRSLVARHLAVLVGAQLVVGAAVAAAMVLARTEVAGSVLYGTAVALVGVVYAALGALATQLVANRRSATALAAAGLAAGLLLRMVADAKPSLGRLSCLSPFGLLGEAEPYAANRPFPLLVLAAAGAVVSVLTVVAAARRDLGAGLIRVADTARARLRLLRSLPGFAVRRLLRAAAVWAVGLAAYFLLIGSLAVSLTDFLADNPRFAELAAAAGFARLDTVEGYVAVLVTLLAIPLGIFAAGRVALDAADEADRRFALLFALPVSRARWAGVQAGVVALAGALLAAVAGLALWIGAALVGAPLGLSAALGGALNVVPVALLCQGAALFALGWAPQAVLPVGVLPAVGGYLVQVLAESFRWPAWVAWLSPYDHLAAVPAASPDWSGAALLLAVAVLLASTGVAGYRRRDLRA